MANDFYITEDDLRQEYDESAEHLHHLTVKALTEAAKFLPSEYMDILCYHCGYSLEDFVKGDTK